MTELFALFCAAPYTYLLLKRYLRYLQQDEYASKRFLKWLFQARAFEKKGSSLSILAALLGANFSVLPLLILAALGFYGTDPEKRGKLPLILTQRASRILGIAVLFSFFALLTLFFKMHGGKFFLGLALFFVAQPLVLIVAVMCLEPYEAFIQKRFLSEAREKIAKIDPFIVAITGSYGKTSTKEALGEVLNIALAPTFWPRKGINTLMGNTRAIREGLELGCGYAVLEMGAYRKGSIRKQCFYFPPKAAIITAVGECHLERFGSKEEIFLAKKELADALPPEGVLVCCGDNEGSRAIGATRGLWQTFYYGFDANKGPLHCMGKDLTVTPDGTRFTICWRGKDYPVLIPVFGKVHALNLMAVFTLVCSLGGDPRIVIGALSNIRGVENRLCVSKEGEVLYLRDAYNSNPQGFQQALEVMEKLPAKKRILMTPGMIELGYLQQVENEKAAKYAAKICDVVLVVGETNKKALLKGLEEGGMAEDKRLYCKNRTEAFAVLKTLAEAGDSVLIENDLPDWYEASERF